MKIQKLCCIHLVAKWQTQMIIHLQKTRPSFEKRYNGCTLKKPGEYLSGQNNSRKLDITRLKKVLCSIEILKICKNMWLLYQRNSKQTQTAWVNLKFTKDKSLIIWKIVVFCCWSFWITFKAYNYPLCHYRISPNRFWSSNKQLKYLGKLDKILFFSFFPGKTKIWALQRRFH